MARNKIIFHIGSQPNATGYGDYIRALDAAGIPAGCMSVGGEGLGDIIACWDAGSLVEHTAVVRYMPPGGGQDVPRYELPEDQAAVSWWSWMKPLIGPDVRRYSPRIVIKCGNELDKNQSEWLAGFYLELYDIMQSDPDGPFRLGAFGFASGEPEPGHWRGPKMLDYLRLCADDPIGASIVLHEYSYADTLQSGYPFLIGRFQDLFAACDENGIKRPYVYIHEWGWRQDVMPPVNEAVTQLPWAAELYAKFPEVKGAGLWTLQGSGTYGNPHISKLVQPMIEPIKNYTLTAEFPDPPINEEPPMEKQIEVIITTELPGQPVQIRGWDKATDRRVKYVQRRWMHHDGNGIVYTGWETIPIPATIADLRGIEFMPVHDFTVTQTVTVDCPDEPSDPNPPPPILTLPAGSKGVDLSNYQAGFFDVVNPADFDFYIFRCSDGMETSATSNNHDANGVDKSLWAFADVAHVSMRPWGIYHFLRPGNVPGQIGKVLGILQALKERGTPPRTAVFDDGSLFTGAWCDFEDWSVSNFQVQQFCQGVDPVAYTGIYSGQYIWNSKASGIVPWWTGRTCWFADYGANNGMIPNRDPLLLNGFYAGHIWQFSSQYGNEAGWKNNSLDINIVGPYYQEGSQPPPPPPPTGESYSTSFMKAVPNAWRVIRRFDNSGEDVYDLPLGGNRFVRVKNFNEGEWYNGNMRERDTSPAPQSDGTERLYLLNGGAGGQIAPDTAVVGVTYSFTNYVQFKSKMGCADLAENSGTAVSTFLLKEVIDNYTFPSTGFTVDRLFWTVQTGENQLYAIKNGVNIGWVGGGAQQDNNVWGGALAELYFDRSIPQQEPPKYC